MDGRLRELERRWQTSRRLDDEIRYRAEGLRSGTLSRDRLTLAAYCGDAAALRVLLDYGALIDSPSDLKSWAKTVALEVQGWRVAAWLLHAALHEAYGVWSMTHVTDPEGPCAAVGSLVSGLRLAADSGYRDVFDEYIKGLEQRIEHAAAREQMWDGAGQEGFVAHLALRAIEIMTLDRWSHTGEIVDRCAQAIHRLRRERGELADVRTSLKEAMKTHIAARAYKTEGPLSGYKALSKANLK